MQVTELKIFLMDEEELKAYADITFDRCFAVHGLKIFRRPTEYYVAMPTKQKDGKNLEIAYPINAEARKMIEEAVMAIP